MLELCVENTQEFADVFKGAEQFSGKCNIFLDPMAIPVYPPWRIPFSLCSHLKDKLDNMDCHQGNGAH
ncbi:hypothetical protein GN956_G9347 [Arapaima gigas]